MTNIRFDWTYVCSARYIMQCKRRYWIINDVGREIALIRPPVIRVRNSSDTLRFTRPLNLILSKKKRKKKEKGHAYPCVR